MNMSIKSRFLQHVVNSVLYGLKLMPIKPQSHIHFIGSKNYSRKLLDSGPSFTDIVVKPGAIEQHEYFLSPHEAYSFTRYAASKDFLRAIVKQRIEWHLTYQVKSSAVKKLHARSDMATLVAANAQLHKDRTRIRQANYQRLEQELNGYYVKLVSIIIGF
jgi:hypothetical protein